MEVLATPVIVPDVVCDQCQQPLIEIDLYGRRWIGCIDCNRWGWPGDSLVRALSEEDITGIRHDTEAIVKKSADLSRRLGGNWHAVVLRPM